MTVSAGARSVFFPGPARARTAGVRRAHHRRRVGAGEPWTPSTVAAAQSRRWRTATRRPRRRRQQHVLRRVAAGDDALIVGRRGDGRAEMEQPARELRRRDRRVFARVDGGVSSESERAALGVLEDEVQQRAWWKASTHVALSSRIDRRTGPRSRARISSAHRPGVHLLKMLVGPRAAHVVAQPADARAAAAEHAHPPPRRIPRAYAGDRAAAAAAARAPEAAARARRVDGAAIAPRTRAEVRGRGPPRSSRSAAAVRARKRCVRVQRAVASDAAFRVQR